jgi:MarR family transcriptional regulator for hemolysin
MNQMTGSHVRPDTQPSTLLGLLGAAHRLEARLESGLAKVSLSHGKVAVLDALARAAQPLQLSEVASNNKCVRSNITQLVDRLEQDGLVRCAGDPGDRRVRLASLTDAGRSSYEAALEIFEQHERVFAHRLGADGTAALEMVLERLGP